MVCFEQRMDNSLHGQNCSVFSEEQLLQQALTQQATLAIPFGSAQPQQLWQSESLMQPSRHWDNGQVMPTYGTYGCLIKPWHNYQLGRPKTHNSLCPFTIHC